MDIIPIILPLPLKMGYVNSYLVRRDGNFLLIDTGGSNGRKRLLQALENAGCTPGRLSIIILTHGDFDHTGNAAHVRAVYGAKIGIHRADAAMGESADMFINRSKPNFLVRGLLSMFTGFGQAERFSPDILLVDGEILSRFGFEAKVIEIPGHSKGSIAILTEDGDLFCGDLMENVKSPGINSIMDNMAEAVSSFEKISGYSIRRVYPGHGNPFTMDQMAAQQEMT